MSNTTILSYCRTCLKNDEQMVSINEPIIRVVLVESASLQVAVNDQLPQKICRDCYDLVQRFYRFKCESLRVETVLREWVKQNEFNPRKLPNLSNEETNGFEVKLEENDVNQDMYWNDDDGEAKTDQTRTNGVLKTSENKCDACGKTFKTKRSLARHVTAMHADEPMSKHKCAMCEKTFSSKDNLDRHALRHTIAPRYQCATCPKKYYELSNLAYHAEQRHKMRADLACDACDDKFILPQQLEKHARAVHSNVRDKHCNICGKSFKKIKKHMRAHEVDKPYKCQKCDRAYRSEINLKIHESRARCRADSKRAVKRLSMCHVCGKEFINPDHILTHSEERPYPCDICSKPFASVTFLRSHKRSVHRAEVSCNICGKLVKRKNLNRHVNNIHKNIRSHACGVCAKTFTTGSHLRGHMRMHTDERPFACDMCSKSFRHKRTMLRHQLIHTGEKPFECKICNKAFNQMSSLKTHLKTHLKTEPCVRFDVAPCPEVTVAPASLSATASAILYDSMPLMRGWTNAH